ncbi:NACHT domain-containing protein [Streptomyces varsoviensis]|uniref:NACHT domain-containing protein n=1 Tax=Streptomyces varsoviensis TaxID=67373 RepID=UPI00068C0418|nr:NACHT domain-containing protein [Streptomyces varsoviensis]
MDPASIGARLASSAVAPLIRKLFVCDGPGAGLVARPVRVSALVSFRGEKRTLDRDDVLKLASHLVDRAVRAAGPHDALPPDEHQAVVSALGSALYSLGSLDMDDVQAVRLGHAELARRLRDRAGSPARYLSTDARYLYDGLLEAACLHILHFFTQRSTFVARTLVEQSGLIAGLIAKTDALIARTPRPGDEDAGFERRYLAHIARKHGKLTIYGIDLTNSPDRWPLDTAYLSLEAREPERVAPLSADEDWRPEETARPLTPPATPLPADQALTHHDRVLLRGVAGSGKTTLVQWLAVSAAGGEDLAERMAYLQDRIPFVLPLRTLPTHGERAPAPDRFLAATGSPLAGAQPHGWADRVLRAGRGLLLIDGVDEVPDADRRHTRTWLRDLVELYPGNRWLITSRPSAVRDDWLASDGFTELTLAPMGRAEVAAFVRRWHTAARVGVSAEESTRLDTYETQLLNAIAAKPDLGRLATNPLMCGLISALHRDRRGFLPSGRKELYDAALSMLLTRRDRERSMSGLAEVELREEPQIQILQKLAYYLIRNGRTEMARSRAEAIIADALPAVREAAAQCDAATLLKHFVQRSGLLREASSESVDFIHRTFQDYLGARAFVEEGDFGLLARNAEDDQWEDVIRMAVAHARPRERAELLGDLLAQGDMAKDTLAQARSYLLSAACLEYAAELDPAVRAEVERRTATLIPPKDYDEAVALASAGPIVLDLLPGPKGLDEETAGNIVFTARHVGSERAIPFLARFTRHESETVHAQLIASWNAFETERYAEEVIAHLPPAGLYFTVRSDEQLHALRNLGTRPMLGVHGDVSPEALTAYAHDATLTHIRIRDNTALTDLSFLAGQTELCSIRIEGCAELCDLSGLGALPLTAVRLINLTRGSRIRRLPPSSRVLDLTLPAQTAWRLEDLPGEAPLRCLHLSRATRPTGGLCGLGRRWPGLTELQLGPDSSPQTTSDWTELGALPHLSDLRIATEALAVLPPGLALPSVRTLRLEQGRVPPGAADLIAGLCPQLTVLSLLGHEPALGPLSGLPPGVEVQAPDTDLTPRGR